ncbi:galectin-9 isoform X8 [Plutella xylostella]|uniref:galectin-9 isoform X8 n=1 Tax=Plutella xylostella TaxID=51655 RepID=UPI0020328E76|nr:galectin-9 isoform X8 [Plutella xylostella]
MASQPIFNPVIPCVQPIPGGAYPGLMIRIRGSSFPNAERFAINLQCGPNTDPRDDIALHLNVRYDHMCIVRNHLASMSWGPEDVDGAMPIARGQAFEALVLVEPSSFKVAFNGVHFCQFSHRLPFQRVSHLTIDGDVSVQSIGFEGAAPPPQYAPPQQQGYYGAPQQPGAYGGGQTGYPDQSNPPTGHSYPPSGPPSYPEHGRTPPGQYYGPPPTQYDHPPAQYGGPQPYYGPPPSQYASRTGGGGSSNKCLACCAASAASCLACLMCGYCKGVGDGECW